ncbi:hypothetical protein [Moritella sp. F3]|uniref:hypothetical protein n=1 Tax=Moritella sp. F3 TaxID=2718882 RepID=UPI0018E101D5|nr:hypothetical protein [Moritella sp. F3]GIC77035.1 hypothetical protein FMO001_17620 [Moritella sp. F1]GIC82154.1 hypothetical protein FMO003_24350 [Moritella sp. F3]
MTSLTTIATNKIKALQKALARVELCKEQLQEAALLKSRGYMTSTFNAEVALSKANWQLRQCL